ncbi:MAG: hypothetical protein LBQ20_05920 [Rhodanobacter sp.]|nr:hypothetical protein [Rhodanobacter sp.]
MIGPIDVLGDSPAGALREDLRQACLDALHIDRATARRTDQRHSYGSTDCASHRHRWVRFSIIQAQFIQV